ncbi:tetratricopeptide repeat-containing sensor histidine kinase [Eudoraea chungangensis]|uniref:tetratricopeptide repeat-containing sensor histidine kinase n=1 Tax=Eudoraea chungangensis TaxID=1481905 RepID=UPI0023EC8309|nr:ATP-binding protein [Eudoraea chungangensis]
MFKQILFPIYLFFIILACQDQNDFRANNTNISLGDSISLNLSKLKSNTETTASKDSIFNRLEQAISKIKIDSTRLEKLTDLSLLTLELGDSLRFKKFNKQAIALSLELRDSIASAGLYWDLGNFYDANFKKDSAYYAFVKAQKVYNNLNRTYETSLMYYNMAVIQKDIKDFTGSEINVIKAIEGFIPLEDNIHLFTSYNLLGTIAKSLKQFNLAQDHFKTAQIYLNKTSSSPLKEQSQSALNNNIGNAFKEEGDFEKSIIYFEKVLESDSLLIKSPESYARTLDNLTFSRFMSGNRKEIEYGYLKALHIQDSLFFLEGAAITNFHLAEYYLSQSDSTKAKSYAVESLRLSNLSSAPNQTLATLRLLSLIEPRNASTFLSRHLELNDSLTELERKTRDKFTRIRFETDSFIKENIVLTKQKQLWVGISIGLFLMALAIYTIIYQRSKNRKLIFLKQQQESNQEVFNLMLSQTQKIEESKQTIQRRISEELHDGVLGQMNGIRMVLLGLNKKNDLKAVNLREDAIVKLQALQEELRTISHELNSASHQKFNNFSTSVDSLLQDTCMPVGLEYKFAYDKSLDLDNLSGDIKINLYRIIQELLHNTVKYASASEVLVKIEGDTDQLRITFVDNGVGFDPKKRKNGIGYKNIGSRIKRLKGSLQISSAPNEGAEIIILIPNNY